MKTIILLLALSVSLSGLAQERFSVSATANTAKFEGTSFDLKKSISYSVAGHVEGKISDLMGYEGYIQYSNYRYDKSTYQSIEAGFFYKFYVVKKMYLAPGFQLSKVVNVKYDGERLKDADKFAPPFYTIGAGYEITDHIIIVSRFNRSLEDNFNYIINVGAKYRF